MSICRWPKWINNGWTGLIHGLSLTGLDLDPIHPFSTLFPSMDRRLDLLILEGTGDTLNDMTIYRRVGVLSLQYVHQSFIASPELVKLRKVSKNSLRSRLGSDSHRRSKRLRQSKEVFEELVAEPWPRRTIIII